MAKTRYTVTNPQALEEAVESETRPSVRDTMLIIGANPEILRAELFSQLEAAHPELKNEHPHALANRVDITINKLVRRGAVRRELIKESVLADFAGKFGLTQLQFQNYYRWLCDSKIDPEIFKPATRQGRMSYHPKVTDVFNAAQPFYQSRKFQALAFGVEAVLGAGKRKSFEEWYSRRLADLALAQRQREMRSVISRIADSGQIPHGGVKPETLYEAMLKALADGKEANAASIRQSLEKKLLAGWAAAGSNSDLLESFTLSLYFALKSEKSRKRGTFPKEILALTSAAIDVCPSGKTFEEYKQSLYAGFSEFWQYAGDAIRAPLQETLDSVVERARVQAESSDAKARITARAVLYDIELLNARYAGGVRTFEKIGYVYGVKKQAVEPHAAKALDLLRGFPEVKALLGRDLIGEWKASLAYASSSSSSR